MLILFIFMKKQQPEKKVKRQHIVPATYLRKFCINDKGKKILYAFNKQTRKVISTQPEKIGKINEFYETVREEQILEKIFSDFEEKYNEIFGEVIKGVDSLTLENKIILSKYLALQFLRTESAKKTWSDIPKSLLKTEKKIHPSFRKEIEDSLNPENILSENKKFILQNFEDFARIILNRKWILLINKTKRPYWTSDNPIAIYSPVKFGGVGLSSPESELYFPLSSKYCLLICDPKKCVNFPSEFESQKENIDFQRCLQVDVSNRFVFSKEREFLIAHKRIKEVPEVAKPDRPTVKRVI